MADTCIPTVYTGLTSDAAPDMLHQYFQPVAAAAAEDDDAAIAAMFSASKKKKKKKVPTGSEAELVAEGPKEPQEPDDTYEELLSRIYTSMV
jgi:hypothetical protein